MTKKIDDYLKYYIGCRVFDESVYNDLTPDLLAWVIKQNRADELKPILRPLSDMTLEDGKYFGIEDEKELGEWKYDFGYFGVLPPDDFHYLLSRGFDLFGLIDAGLAIDKTKLP